MNLVFVTDHKFIRDRQGVLYTTGQMTKEYLSKYLPYFNKIIVIGREEKLNNENRLKCIEPVNLFSQQISFRLANSTSKGSFIGIYYELIKLCKKTIRENDSMICKMPNISSSFAVHYAKRYHKQYLIEMVGCPWDAFWNHSIKGKILAPYMYLTTKFAIKNAPFVLYVTNQFLQNRYSTKGNSLNCSDVSIKKPDEQVLINRINKIKNRSDKIVLGTAAALNVKYKGQKYVIKTISELLKKGYNIEYQLAGGGETKHLRKIADKFGVSDRVVFLGTIPHDKIFDWFDNLDVYIQPSKIEGLPRSIIEAMSRGCPVIASNVGGIPELLDKECLFKKADIKGIMRCIINLLKSDLRERAVRNFNIAQKFEKSNLILKRQRFYRYFSEKGKIKCNKK